MRIAHVIPIARGVPKETLTYFSTLPVTPGALVEVSIRTRIIPALVVFVEDAEAAKGELKRAAFPVKKINRIIASQFLRQPFFDAAVRMADYSVGTKGSTLASLLPLSILEELIAGSDKTLTEENSSLPTPHPRPTLAPERLALQTADEDRFANYRSVIRSEFAKKKSVFLLLPTIEEAKRVAHILEKGIEAYTVLLHGAIKKQEAIAAFARIKTATHPLCIIATSTFLCAAPLDTSTFIIEHESSPAYKLPTRPFIDVRLFTQHLATFSKAAIIFGDVLLRIETLERIRRGDITELSPLKWRPLFSAPFSVIDARTPTTTAATTGMYRKKKEFSALTPAFLNLVQQAHDEHGRLFVYTTRRGLAPTTVCEDCGTTVLCTRCGAPVILHLGDPREEAGNVFVCNHCGEKRTAAEACKTCTGWRLVPLGIGIDRVVEELRAHFPDISILKLDKESARSSSAAHAIAKKFTNTPGSILVGTEMALLYIEGPLEYVAIASMDSLFALPDFRITEKALGILLRLRALAGRQCVLQTRIPDAPVIACARTGSLIDFFRDESSVREALHYPPFKLLIKISAEGKRETIYDYLHTLAEKLLPEQLEIFPAFIKSVKGKFILHGLLRINPKDWPHTRIHEILRSASDDCTIRVDPESIL